jgi:YfiH family protein
LVAGITARGADFGLASPEPAIAVLGRWRAFRQGLAPAFSAVVAAHQCHGTAVAVHGDLTPGWHVLDGVDGHCTNTPGVLLAVTVADCVPIYMAEPRSGWLGLLHAGWRGIAQGILERGVETLSRLAGSSPGNIVIHCGVSICGNCYEVGSEVGAAVLGVPWRGNGKLDLRAVLERRARLAGVHDVTASPWCTAHDVKAFYSHRGSGGKDGRMLAYLGRPAA